MVPFFCFVPCSTPAVVLSCYFQLGMQVWEGYVEGQEEANKAAAAGAKASEAKAINVSINLHVAGSREAPNLA